jgi:hypothetical protein
MPHPVVNLAVCAAVAFSAGCNPTCSQPRLNRLVEAIAVSRDRTDQCRKLDRQNVDLTHKLNADRSPTPPDDFAILSDERMRRYR